MLVSLHVSNFVLIEDCRIEFHPGLNILTGETGAGKSILAGALGLLVGERGSPESARDTEKDAVIEAEFALDPASPHTREIQALLDESGIPWDDETLLIKRILSPGGRGRIFVNDTSCLLKKLKDLGERLMDLHGQHEHQSLLRKSSYRPLLDRFGGYAPILDAYRTAYNRWQDIRRRLHELETNERERRRREDTLRYQLEEIDKARLAEGEDERVADRLQVIQHAGRLSEWCADAVRTLTGDDERPALLDELDRLETLLANLRKLDPRAAAILEMWQPAAISLREAARELQTYALTLEFDPAELEELQQRHYLLKNLKNKYGATVAEILQYREACRAELARMDHLEEERETLQNEEADLRAQVVRWGRALHDERLQNAAATADRIREELRSLGMDQAEFEIQTAYRRGAAGLDIGEEQPVLFGPDGGDEVEFLITTIPGRPPRPLREVASGGEISRIMLAIKCVFGQADAVPLMVFDEIDVGVGGRTADAVGERLAQLARGKQVLCITHLPQIASRAQRNLRVDKKEVNGRLISTVDVLKGKEREAELARMLGGEDLAASKKFARELIKGAKRG
ncbi:MAG: DNA repair protein RecN [bacterium]